METYVKNIGAIGVKNIGAIGVENIGPIGVTTVANYYFPVKLGYTAVIETQKCKYISVRRNKKNGYWEVVYNKKILGSFVNKKEAINSKLRLKKYLKKCRRLDMRRKVRYGIRTT